MKFSHGEVHVWTQYALCLISLGRYVHAYSVLQVVIKLAPQKVMPCLLAARLCYEHLNKVIIFLYRIKLNFTNFEVLPEFLILMI